MLSSRCGENLIWTLDKGVLTINGKCEKNLAWQIKGDTFTISGNGAMEDYLNKNSPWYDCKELIKKIIVCDGITSIGKNAFRGCVNLTEIKIPEGVTKIGDNAFSWCLYLTEIRLPASVKTIGHYAFSYCTYLRVIKIPNSVTTIGEGAFWDCKNLREITIPDSVIKIGAVTFAFCPKLEEIYYPAGSGFEGSLGAGNYAELIPCKELFWKIVGNKVKLIDADEKLRWKVEGRTLTVGGMCKIKNYSNENPPWGDSRRIIQKIVIEDGVKKIYSYAFADCTRLEKLTIPVTVKTIGDFAFTVSYCGDRLVNNGRNVFWSLNNGTLILKKNPAAKSDDDFSTGYETWKVVEKNIKGVKIERGIVLGKRFYNWLEHMNSDLPVAFL